MSDIIKPTLQKEEERLAFLNSESNRVTIEINDKKKELEDVVVGLEKRISELEGEIELYNSSIVIATKEYDNLLSGKSILIKDIIELKEENNSIANKGIALLNDSIELEKLVAEKKKYLETTNSSIQKNNEESSRLLSEVSLKKIEIDELERKNKKENERLSIKSTELKNREDLLINRETLLDQKRKELTDKEKLINSKEVDNINIKINKLKDLEVIHSNREEKVREIENTIELREEKLSKREEDFNKKKLDLDIRERELSAREQDCVIRDTEIRVKEKLVKAKEKLLA